MTGTSRATRPAFTIVEMLVAVAAVTLIALGVAQVFTATGAEAPGFPFMWRDGPRRSADQFP